MKKFVSFCAAVAVAACAVPAMAQCSSCGAAAAPVFSQPVSTYVPQATYSAPVMSTPVYSAPMMSTPVYSAPVMSAPIMSAPIMSSVPVISSNCGGCTSGCGGTVMSGQVISSGATMGVSLPAGAQIISWEGGAPIQGTVVSDVLVKGGEAAATEGTATESTVDVVEPPVADEPAEEETPGPDTVEAETEGDT